MSLLEHDLVLLLALRSGSIQRFAHVQPFPFPSNAVSFNVSPIADALECSGLTLC